jgi:hypothetical protein
VAPCSCELVSTTDIPRNRGEPGSNSSAEGGKTKLGVDELNGTFGLAPGDGDGVALLTLFTGGMGASGTGVNFPSRTKRASW